jgi:hypothetical protein
MCRMAAIAEETKRVHAEFLQGGSKRILASFDEIGTSGNVQISYQQFEAFCESHPEACQIYGVTSVRELYVICSFP